MSQDVRSFTIDQTPSPEVYLEGGFSDDEHSNLSVHPSSGDDDDDGATFRRIEHHNVPPPMAHFVGDHHESVLDQIHQTLTTGDEQPLIVLLGGEGLGKSSVVTTACNDVLDDAANCGLFEDGILYLELLKWQRLYHVSTLEDALILALQQCGLSQFWIERHDDWNVTTSNVFEYVDRYLTRSLIVPEDVDRFLEDTTE